MGRLKICAADKAEELCADPAGTAAPSGRTLSEAAAIKKQARRVLTNLEGEDRKYMGKTFLSSR